STAGSAPPSPDHGGPPSAVTSPPAPPAGTAWDQECAGSQVRSFLSPCAMIRVVTEAGQGIEKRVTKSRQPLSRASERRSPRRRGTLRGRRARPGAGHAARARGG